MEYTDAFKKFVDTCNLEVNQYYAGIGNPNAKILFVGKEFAASEADAEYKENAKDWERHIAKGTCQCLEYLVDEGHLLGKGWGGNTWSKYQKLKYYIFNMGDEERKFYVDFLKEVFTTEINDAPSLKTSIADKSSLNARKRLFKESLFIQSFPVVVLACSNYVRNNDEIREIDDIFGVTYDGDETGKYYYNKNNWFFTHHNSNNDKLVIHTRQLSTDVVDKMLQDMATVIRAHLCTKYTSVPLKLG